MKTTNKFQQVGPFVIKRAGLKLAVGGLVVFLSLGPFTVNPQLFTGELASLKNIFQKQEAQAAAGDVILLWDNTTSSIPAGWECISCEATSTFLNVFPMASSSFASASSSADTHTVNASSGASTAESGTTSKEDNAAGTQYISTTHTHSVSESAADSTSSLPLFKELIFIRANNPSEVPAGAIGIFDVSSSSLPAGWSWYSDMDGRYLRGSNASTTGGLSEHNHSFSILSTTAANDEAKAGGPSADTVAGGNNGAPHAHTVSGNSGNASNTPPFINVVFGKITANGSFPDGIIAFFDDAGLPTDWSIVSTSGSAYADRLLRGSDTFGGTGGSSTHGHGSATVTSGAPDSTNNTKNTGIAVPIGTHTHDFTVTFSSSSSLPIYREAILGKFSPPAANPQIRAAANQTFTAVSTNAISAITVTSTGASQITAADDIRVTLATSSGAPVLFWDTSDTTLTKDAGSGDISTTVSYENGSSTLVVDVLTDFANASSVTFSALSYIASSTVNAATTTRDLKWTGAGQAPPFVRDTRTATIRGRLSADEHSTGQEADKYAAASSTANAELFAFQLDTPDEAASTTLIVQLSSIIGIVTSDITGTKIYKDANADGDVADAGDALAWDSGSVSISGGTGSITFSTPTSTVSATSTRYILVATTTNLLAGDTVTFGLGASDVSATGTTSGVALAPTAAPPSNAAHTVNAVNRNQRSFRWQNDDGASVNGNTNMTAADTDVSGVKIGQRLTIRMQADNDGGGDAGIAYKLQFQANATSGTWSDVAGGSEIRYAEGLAGSNGAPITSAVAAANARTFTNGLWSEGTAVSNSQTLLNDEYTELGFMIDTANATTSASSTYYFRMVNNADNQPLNNVSVFPALTTVAPASNTIQYSKQATTTIPNGTSSLTFFFDDIDYARAASDDATYSTTTASANHPVTMFRTKASTSSHPVKITWNGQVSAASSTILEIYRKGSTNAWVELNSSSTPGVDADFSLAGGAATSVAEYYDADGSDFWVYARIRQTTTTSDLRTDHILFEFMPTAESAAEQTFEVNDAATAISQISVKASTDTAVITAANDIRLVIPDSLNMTWDTADTLATLGGSASGKASTTVQYPNNKTLLVNVETDFAAGDDLTVSDLSFASFTSASASTTLDAFYGGSTSTAADAIDARIKQIRGEYDLGAHAAGQEGNKFDVSGSSVTDELLNFQIAPTGESATSTQVVVDLTDIDGIAAADVTSTQIFFDLNDDGDIDAGDVQVGATGTVAISGQSGTITFSGNFAVTSTRNMILRATVNNLDAGDGMNVLLSTGGLTADGQTSRIALAPQGTSQNKRHNKPSQRGSGTPGKAPSVANVGGGGAGGGGATGNGEGDDGGDVGGGGAGGGGATP